MPVVYSADGDPAAQAGGGKKLGPVAAVVLVVIATGLVGWRFKQARQAAPEPAPMTAGGEAAMAPGGGGPGGPGGGQRSGFAERVAEELGLTEEQQAQMAEAGAIGSKMAAVREDASLTDEQRREKYREILDEQQAAYAKILTPEQQKKFEELQAARRSQGGGQGGPGGQGGGRQGWMTRLAEQLELTAEQKPKWDKLREDYEAKRQALRDDTALSDEDRRTKMTELREQQNEDLKAILTPEQQQKMEALQAERAQNFGSGGGPGGGGGPRGEGGGPGGGGGEQAAPQPAPSQT